MYDLYMIIIWYIDLVVNGRSDEQRSVWGALLLHLTGFMPLVQLKGTVFWHMTSQNLVRTAGHERQETVMI